jgi:hypothetical protein
VHAYVEQYVYDLSTTAYAVSQEYDIQSLCGSISQLPTCSTTQRSVSNTYLVLLVSTSSHSIQLQQFDLPATRTRSFNKLFLSQSSVLHCFCCLLAYSLCTVHPPTSIPVSSDSNLVHVLGVFCVCRRFWKTSKSAKSAFYSNDLDIMNERCRGI